jgi:hypothetical protein
MFFNTWYKDWHARDVERAQQRMREREQYNARLQAAVKKTTDAEEGRITVALAKALAAHDRFLTLGTNTSYEWFVGFVTKMANEEPKVLDVKFHSYTKDLFGLESGKATLTLDVTNV